MKTKTYSNKQSDVPRLTEEIIAAGLPQDPNSGARFYGCTCVLMNNGQFQTTVLCYDDITQEEEGTIATVVGNHIPTPLPQEDPFLKDQQGKLWVKAESRPLNCTTLFTTRGDVVGASPDIGEGPRMEWDASVPGEWTTVGAPTGYKRKVIDIQFCDSIWLKEGSVYYMGAKKGSRIDMEIVCPNGGYYIYLGEVRQNTTGNDLVIEHYVNDLPIQGDVPMGDELNTETCSQELPNYLKFKLEVTIPESDVDSYGYAVMEIYRQRTVVI